MGLANKAILKASFIHGNTCWYKTMQIRSFRRTRYILRSWLQIHRSNGSMSSDVFYALYYLTSFLPLCSWLNALMDQLSESTYKLVWINLLMDIEHLAMTFTGDDYGRNKTKWHYSQLIISYVEMIQSGNNYAILMNVLRSVSFFSGGGGWWLIFALTLMKI